MYTVTKPYPKEFRDDVVRVARNREPSRREGWLNSEAPQW